MSDEEKITVDEDKKFYMGMVNRLVAISEVNATHISENNKIIQAQNLAIQELTLSINEIKIALQNRSCIVDEKIEQVNNRWESATIKTYHYVMAALFTLIIGILTAFGLYSPKP